MPFDRAAARRPAAAAIPALQAAIDSVIAPLLDGRPAALIDFPDHSNVGDSAIWLGERAFFDAHGASIGYCSSLKTHSTDELAARIPDGTVFLHGGGNFGTIWKPHQDLRLEQLRRLRDHRIVQLPQSLFFGDDAAVSEIARAIEKHGRFTLLVRDQPSLEFARRHFPCEVRLCPDMAFYLGALDRRRPAVDVFYLLRTDRERSIDGQVRQDGRTVAVADWLTENRQAMRRVSAVSRLLTLGDDPAAGRLKKYDRLARARLKRGIALLSSGRVVVTDRLHGHIMATLLDIPNVALDNSYRKLGNFIDAWTHDIDVVHVAAAIDEASDLAAALLDRQDFSRVVA